MTAGATTVPVRLTECGLPEALSETVTAALRMPFAVAVNVTLTEQLAPGATLAPQVLVCAKSLLLVPVVAMLVMVSAASPAFERVKDLGALEVLTCWFPNERLVGERLTAGAVPVPVRLTICGLPLASSVTVIAPLLVPVAVGVKVTLIAQFPPAATELPQELV